MSEDQEKTKTPARRESTRGRVLSGEVDSGTQQVAEAAELSQAEKITLAILKYPNHKLEEMAKSLGKSLRAYPEQAQGTSRTLTFHTQTTPDTIRLFVELVEALCR